MEEKRDTHGHMERATHGRKKSIVRGTLDNLARRNYSGAN